MVNGTKKFLFLGNEPALDLLNTTPVLAEGAVDMLETFADLTHWLAAAGLVDVATAEALRRRWEGTKDGETALLRAKKVREALREILMAREGGKKVPAKAIDTINDVLRAARGTTHIRWDEKQQRFSRQSERESDGKAAEAVTAVAEAAAELLTGKDLDLVRKCENPACVLHFYDTSKNHRRRWCSMEICGNRMKVAAHYRRQKEERDD